MSKAFSSALLIVLLSTSPGCTKPVPPVPEVPPPIGCVEVAAWAAMVSFFCPANTDRAHLGRWLSAVAQKRSSSHQHRQIHILVSSVLSAAAKGPRDINYVADTVLATVDWNRNSGFIEMKCRVDPKADISDCTHMLPK